MRAGSFLLPVCAALLMVFTGCGKESSSSTTLTEEARSISADTAASTLRTACTAAVSDIYAEGEAVTGEGWMSFAGGKFKSNSKIKLTSGDAAARSLNGNIKTYFPEFSDCTGAVYLRSGECVAVVITTDGTNWGSYPGGMITSTGITEAEAKAAVSSAVKN